MPIDDEHFFDSFHAGREPIASPVGQEELYEWVPTGAVPASLPVLVDRDGTLDARAVDTAVRVSAVLPTALRTQVRALLAASPGSVLLVLAGGRVVVWGGPADVAAKTRVATALLGGTKAPYVDVSVPTAPVTRGSVPAGLVPPT